jgi:DNA-binding response OmpR family regulator
MNILVVDDDVSLTLFISRVLTSEGHRVLTAPNNIKVKIMLQSEHIDMAICDLVLPGHDGSDIIKTLKEHDPSTYCILISGYYNESFNNYKVLVGADDVIPKPVTKEILQELLGKCLHFRQQGKA